MLHTSFAPTLAPCSRNMTHVQPLAASARIAPGRQPCPAPLQQRTHTTVAAAATTGTHTTSWLQALNPFGRKAVATAPAVPTVSAAELDLMLQSCSEVPLVVLFSATWCGPCKVMMQRLEKLLQELGPRGLTVVKIDTEESEGGSALATQLGIYKLPTMMFCGPQDGKSVVQVQGLVKEAVLVDLIMNRCQFLGNDLQNGMKW